MQSSSTVCLCRSKTQLAQSALGNWPSHPQGHTHRRAAPAPACPSSASSSPLSSFFHVCASRPLRAPVSALSPSAAVFQRLCRRLRLRHAPSASPVPLWRDVPAALSAAQRTSRTPLHHPSSLPTRLSLSPPAEGFLPAHADHGAPPGLHIAEAGGAGCRSSVSRSRCAAAPRGCYHSCVSGLSLLLVGGSHTRSSLPLSCGLMPLASAALEAAFVLGGSSHPMHPMQGCSGACRSWPAPQAGFAAVLFVGDPSSATPFLCPRTSLCKSAHNRHVFCRRCAVVMPRGLERLPPWQHCSGRRPSARAGRRCPCATKRARGHSPQRLWRQQ